MTKCPFKVGDRLRMKYAVKNIGFGVPVTVTEVLADGTFKWKTEEPVSLGPRFGTFSNGHCYNPEVYERADNESST